jgi:uncharacterized protein (TIGR03435 family)
MHIALRELVENRFVAIEEQLGLRLVEGRAEVDVLVVDPAERPVPD